MNCRFAAAAAAALAVILVVPSGLATAQPIPGLPEPNSAARRAGVEPGNAPMGWSLDRRSSGSSLSARTGPTRMTGVVGIDVASYQGNVNWAAYKKQGKVFAYVKATEGTSYRNPYFRQQYFGSAAAGLIRGSYHFANPAGASGRAQADYFLRWGGWWTKDGKTLPGVLDIEYNPYGSMCYGVSKATMIKWISDFTTRYKERTKRDVVIYTTAGWWTACTGNTSRFSSTNPSGWPVGRQCLASSPADGRTTRSGSTAIHPWTRTDSVPRTPDCRSWPTAPERLIAGTAQCACRSLSLSKGHPPRASNRKQ